MNEWMVRTIQNHTHNKISKCDKYALKKSKRMKRKQENGMEERKKHEKSHSAERFRKFFFPLILSMCEYWDPKCEEYSLNYLWEVKSGGRK